MVAHGNHIPFNYVLSDVWYSAADNMMFAQHDLKKDFIKLLKANRAGQWVRIARLMLEPNTTQEIYLESVDFPLLKITLSATSPN